MAVSGLQLQIIDPALQAPGALFTFGLPSPRMVTGKYKLLSRWLAVFFTPKGSSYLQRDAGTYFTDALSGNVVDKSDFQTHIHDCIEDATEQVKQVDNNSPWLTDDERLDTVSLTSFEQSGDSAFVVWVELRNLRGQRLSVLLPYAQAA